jgi:putative colanic acid biosynthesis UDP-glucose lipid carrier transferase
MSPTPNVDGIVQPSLRIPGDWGAGPRSTSNDPVDCKAVTLGSSEPVLWALARRFARPVVVVIVLGLCVAAAGQPLSIEFSGLGLVAFLVAAQVMSPLELPSGTGFGWRGGAVARLAFEWMCVVAILASLAVAFKLTRMFAPDLLAFWAVATPVALLLAQTLSLPAARRLSAGCARSRRCIIIGANEVGVELARRIGQIRGAGKVVALLDHRTADRLAMEHNPPITPGCTATGIAEFVRDHAINRVYIALPLSKVPRIEELLKELRDTTTSVYLVPNIFAFDLMHAQCIEINGMPAFSICESPLQGMGGIWKRVLDIAIAGAALAAIWPVMLAITLLIKQSSPGPALFKQRRYGLNGEEILVYKFRTMRACEDGDVVKQATRDDSRVTPIGRLLRRSSLDELPQILNVLEGKMSIVGPRPHAIAHNEEYRKLISGYMIRHKVRPGITGWAQVNGLRGETSTIERMRSRIDYDLDYLKNWSLWLDVKIIARTLLTLFNDGNAY